MNQAKKGVEYDDPAVQRIMIQIMKGEESDG